MVRIVETLGLPPSWLLAEAKHTNKYFKRTGEWCGVSVAGRATQYQEPYRLTKAKGEVRHSEHSSVATGLCYSLLLVLHLQGGETCCQGRWLVHPDLAPLSVSRLRFGFRFCG